MFECQILTIQFNRSIVFVYTQLNVKTVLFRTIQFRASTVSMPKAVLFQVIQFSISTQFSSTLGQSGPGSDGNEGVLCIPQRSLSDCLVSYLGHSLGWGSYSSAEVQSVYSTAPANWAVHIYPTFYYEQEVTLGYFVKWSIAGLNSVFLLIDSLPYQG